MKNQTSSNDMDTFKKNIDFHIKDINRKNI